MGMYPCAQYGNSDCDPGPVVTVIQSVERRRRNSAHARALSTPQLSGRHKKITKLIPIQFRSITVSITFPSLIPPNYESVTSVYSKKLLMGNFPVSLRHSVA